MGIARTTMFIQNARSINAVAGLIMRKEDNSTCRPALCCSWAGGPAVDEILMN